MGPTEGIMLLMFLGAVVIFGIALLIGINIGKKQAEMRCPFCKGVISKGATRCHWCGREMPGEPIEEKASL